MIEVPKTFAETRKIEHIIVKLTPKEKYVINEFMKQSGVSNFSEWARIVMFREIDSRIQSGELTLF